MSSLSSMGSMAQRSQTQQVVLPKGGKAQRVDDVQVDGLTLMKILKHARENPNEAASGPLLGLVVNHTLEVTNCFPFPSRTGEPADDDEGGARFQIEMLKCLREVNVDHLQVGWYQTTPLGSYLTEQLIQTQYEYQKQIEESVVLIYDPVRTAQGTLSLRAFRLSNSFMDLWKEQTFSAAALREKKISFENVFKEVKVLIRTSHMARALLYELEDQTLRKKQEQLDISSSSFLERNVRSMMDCVDELANESNKYHYYLRNVQRQQSQQQQILTKRKHENAARVSRGQPELPEDDIQNNPIFKPIPLPSRLDSLLITGQINHYCNTISEFASSNYGKLFLAQGLQDA